MGQCRPVGSGDHRSSSVLHQQGRNIFCIENACPCPQDCLMRKKKTPGQPQWQPNTALSEGLYMRSSSWLHDIEERRKGRCCRVGPCGGGRGWRQWEGWGGRRSLAGLSAFGLVASCPLTAIRNPLVIQYAQWMVGSEPQPRRTQSGMTRGSCARCTRDSEEKIQNRWRRRVLPFNISVYDWFGSTVEIYLTH